MIRNAWSREVMSVPRDTAVLCRSSETETEVTTALPRELGDQGCSGKPAGREPRGGEVVGISKREGGVQRCVSHRA